MTARGARDGEGHTGREASAVSNDWWQGAVIYQVYPRSFQDSNGDGIGDLPGITRRLDHLAWMGFDALWLSPFFPSPLADFGYDVSDYTAVDPVFGTLDDLDELVTRAHKLGLRVILDLVPNHTSIEHQWFVESRRSRNDARRDWYIWRDPAPDGGPPNNWLSPFGGSAWAYDAATGQYYLHSFLPEQPDLNWRNPKVVDAMHGVMRFWLDRGVDGFRVDVIHFMLKDAEFRDDPVNPNHVAGPGSNPWHGLLHVHSSDLPEVHELVRGFRVVIDQYDNRVLIGEIEYGSSVERVCSYYGAGDELHVPLNFALMTLPWHAPTIAEFMAHYDESVPATCAPSYVIGNHDRSRVATRLGATEARVAAMLLLAARNTPFVYYGDELGMCDAHIPTELIRDPWGMHVPGHGRDMVRTPMRWDATPSGGFSDATPWLPSDGQEPGTDVATQRDDPASSLSLYRRMLALRRQRAVFLHGRQRVSLHGNDVLVLERTLEGEKVLMLANFGTTLQTMPLGTTRGGTVVVATVAERDGERVVDEVAIGAREAVIVAFDL